jgi:hypothetical protein
MIARISLVAFVLLGLNRPALATPVGPSPAPCGVAQLDAYILLGSTGCSVGGEVAFYDFDFSVLASEGGAIAIAASDILVTPTLTGQNRTLTFSSAGFSVTGTEAITYEVSYNVDPHPILFGFAIEMETFTPVAPGIADIDTQLCIGAPFTPACAGTPAVLNVFHAGTTSDLFDSVAFGSAVADVGVRNAISLTANGASADFDNFSNTLRVPEPAALWLIALGVVGRTLARRRRPLR